MRSRSLVLFALLSLAGVPSLMAEVRRALLIGINTYQPAQTAAQHPAGCTGGRCDLPQFDNLDGAVNDVAAMRDLLVSPKFGFNPANVTVLTNPGLPPAQLPFVTLPASDTSHDGILAALQKYLVDTPQKGDTVVLYYAGHGSLRINTRGTKLTMIVDGKVVHADSTLVPSDAWKGGYDVRDREMTRIFNAALDRGIKLTVILDSCHSGAFTRGVPLGPKVKERMLPYDPRDIDEAPDGSANGPDRLAPAERTDNPALIFSAAQQDQTAKEAATTDSTPEPHGAFTAALLKALASLPADAPASVVYQQVRAELEADGIEDQMPSLDAAATRRDQPLFGGAAAEPGKLRTAIVNVNVDGSVTLDTGRLAGIGPGSTFVSYAVADKAKQVTLKVTKLQGIGRSMAELVSPAHAHLVPGQVFELATWTPAPVDPLHFWTWPALGAEADVQAAMAAVRAAGVDLVADPAEQPWTDMLAWNGTSWTLAHAGNPKTVDLGAKLSADALKRALPAGAKLWANLPPPQDLVTRLNLHVPDSMVEGVADVAAAEYVLAGSVTPHGPAWAWYHKTEFEKGPPKADAPRHSPGCSWSSNYPVRSDWIAAADGEAVPDAASKLSELAGRLAKLAGWLRLPSSPGTGEDDYYHLTFIKAADTNPLAPGQTVRQGDKIRLMLTSSERVLEKRWVYVLDIDCQGNGDLLYPRNYSENRFPNDANDQRQIVLPGGPVLTVSAPFGLDTILLISTSDPLSDPYSLNFKGVATRGGLSTPHSPLERLLSNTSSGTRGLDLGAVPTDWSVSLSGLQSVPAAP